MAASLTPMLSASPLSCLLGLNGSPAAHALTRRTLRKGLQMDSQLTQPYWSNLPGSLAERAAPVVEGFGYLLEAVIDKERQIRYRTRSAFHGGNGFSD